MYSYSFRQGLEKELHKLAKKHPSRMRALSKQVHKIVKSEDASRFKNLRHPLNHLKRVHVGSFVLLFSVGEDARHVVFEAFEHHDRVYDR